jgi:UDP-N-acetylmuramoyl-tripeptide--D-alanyl-D-alanine ligase
VLIAKAEAQGARIVTFGLKQGADVRAREAVPASTGGTLVVARCCRAELCFTVGAPGRA